MLTRSPHQKFFLCIRLWACGKQTRVDEEKMYSVPNDNDYEENFK